jgi:rare lipoprotein A (peptidoglycan hydrolase)
MRHPRIVIAAVIALVLGVVMLSLASDASAHTVGHKECWAYAKDTKYPRYSFRQCMRRAKIHNASHVLGQGTAVASWYGPCCYGGSTANGTPFHEGTWGVAHLSWVYVPGAKCTFWYKGRVARNVPVNDHGPHVAGRTFDLSGAVKTHLRFNGVDVVRYRCTRP